MIAEAVNFPYKALGETAESSITPRTSTVAPPDGGRLTGINLGQTRPEANFVNDGAVSEYVRPIIGFLKKGGKAGLDSSHKLTVDFSAILKNYWQRIFSKDPNKQNMTNGKFLAIAGLGLTAALMTFKSIFETGENVMGSDNAKNNAPLPFLILKLIIGGGLALTAHNTITKNGKPGSQNAGTLVAWFIAFVGLGQVTNLFKHKPNLLSKVTDFCGITKPLKEFMDIISFRSLNNSLANN